MGLGRLHGRPIGDDPTTLGLVGPVLWAEHLLLRVRRHLSLCRRCNRNHAGIKGSAAPLFATRRAVPPPEPVRGTGVSRIPRRRIWPYIPSLTGQRQNDAKHEFTAGKLPAFCMAIVDHSPNR